MSNFSVNTMSADALALLGARPSADAVIINFRSHIHKKPSFEGLNSTEILYLLTLKLIVKFTHKFVVIPLLSCFSVDSRFCIVFAAFCTP